MRYFCQCSLIARNDPVSVYNALRLTLLSYCFKIMYVVNILSLDKSPVSSPVSVSPTVTTIPSMPGSTPGSLSTGAIAGIAVGGVIVIVAILIILLVGLLICKLHDFVLD